MSKKLLTITHDGGAVDFHIAPEALHITELSDIVRLRGVLEDIEEELKDKEVEYYEESLTEMKREG